MADPRFPPRDGDLPRAELFKAAEEALRRYPAATVHFNFTCPACGERCTLERDNYLYEQGECHACGHVTEIRTGGFALVFDLGVPRG